MGSSKFLDTVKKDLENVTRYGEEANQVADSIRRNFVKTLISLKFTPQETASDRRMRTATEFGGQLGVLISAIFGEVEEGKKRRKRMLESLTAAERQIMGDIHEAWDIVNRLGYWNLLPFYKECCKNGLKNALESYRYEPMFIKDDEDMEEKPVLIYKKKEKETDSNQH